MSPSAPNARKRPRGEGAVFQRCESRRGCPPIETVTLPDGTTEQRRPKHNCKGLWIARLDLGRGPDGKPRRPQRAATTRNKALIKLNELKEQHVKHGDVPLRNMTVEQWLKQWLDEIHKPNVGPGTYQNDRSRINKHLIPSIGKHRLPDLKPRHLRELYAHMYDTGSVGMRPGVHRTLHKALNDAMREGLVVRNVAALVEAPGGKGTKRTALTASQGRTLLRYTHREDDDGKLIDRMASRWGMALLTAARQGECLGLEWQRVNLEDRVMDVAWQLRRLLFAHGCGPEPDGDQAWSCGKRRAGYCPDRHFDLPDDYECRQLVGGMCLVRPKSEASIRLLPIPAPLYADLKAHKKSDSTPNPHGLVWREDDGAPIDAATDRARWFANLTAARLPRVLLHEARHTTITLLMEAGVDPAIIQAIAGHSSLAVQEGYKHVDIRHTAEALGKVAGELYLREIES